MDLTIRCVDKVKSAKLALAISRIACKILSVLKSSFLEKVNRVGCSLAERISEIAVSWGCREAVSWKHELGFINYLGATALNGGSDSTHP